MEQVPSSGLSGDVGSALDARETSREAHFVSAVFRALSENKGLAARLRRADNPSTEYQAWDFLASFGVDLEKDYERQPYAIIAAAICKSDQSENGTARLGQALASVYDKGSEGPGHARLLRLLACDDLNEVCRILRPLFSLLAHKSKRSLDYASLLKQLTRYGVLRQRIRAQWAQDFYRETGVIGEKP